jgi:hypothetical protein
VSRVRRGAAIVVVTVLSSLGLGAFVTAAPADAYYCGKLDPVCGAVCRVGYRLGFQCID